jgi:hypothetical protein
MIKLQQNKNITHKILVTSYLCAVLISTAVYILDEKNTIDTVVISVMTLIAIEATVNRIFKI